MFRRNPNFLQTLHFFGIVTMVHVVLFTKGTAELLASRIEVFGYNTIISKGKY
jgi:hypothetical protein